MLKKKYGEEGRGRRKEENGKERGGGFRGMDNIYGRMCVEKVWRGKYKERSFSFSSAINRTHTMARIGMDRANTHRRYRTCHGCQVAIFRPRRPKLSKKCIRS